ncbi:LOW QUALITY PROTEIN: hypothetical protein HID58_028716 [Brassica napus]|uniref:Uncharacterized protein n=1 Tax=Brassica napus TaxID=3708 RepID=A0ABQ8CB05_BRANA|nr:LOW QUALITY PROTEIN: hypothetical protein HID58_028716 [Brassica napus]
MTTLTQRKEKVFKYSFPPSSAMDAEEKMELKVYNKMTLAEGRKFLIRSLPERSDCTSVDMISVTSAMLAPPSPWTFSTGLSKLDSSSETLLDECTLPVSSEFSQLDSSSEAFYYVYQILMMPSFHIEKQWLKKTVEKLNRLQKPKTSLTSSKSEFEAKMLDDLYTHGCLPRCIEIHQYLNYLMFSDLLLLLFFSCATSPFIPNLSKMLKKQRALKLRKQLDVLGLLTTLSYAENTNKSRKKEFEKSDQIRAVQGIAVMDIGKETVWRPMLPFSG